MKPDKKLIRVLRHRISKTQNKIELLAEAVKLELAKCTHDEDFYEECPDCGRIRGIDFKSA